MNLQRFLALAGFVVATAAQATTVSLSPSTVSTVSGSQFFVDVIIDGLSGPEVVGGFDLDVVFNPSILSASSVAFGSALGVDGIDQFSNFILTHGRIDFAAVSLLAGPDLLAFQGGPFSLARLTFDAVAAGSSDITFDLTTPTGLLFSDEFGGVLAVSGGSEAGVLVTVSNVPEPSSLALALLGLLAVASFAGGRRRS